MHHSKRHHKKNKMLNKSKKILARGISGVTNVLKDTTNDFFNLINKNFSAKKSRRRRNY